jgi:hypothetical protein
MGGFEAAGLQEAGKKWLLQCAFVRAHRERTLPRGAVAGGRRGAVNVPATSTSTTIQPVVVTLPLLLQAAVFLTAPSGSAAACAAARCGSPCRTPRYERGMAPLSSVVTRVRLSVCVPSASGPLRWGSIGSRKTADAVAVRLTPDERELRLERRCPACPT